MDAELSLLMANQALVRRGDLVIDPFAGTGSVMVGAAHFGAYSVGCDIDPRVLRGPSKERSVRANFAQYGFPARLLGLVVNDFSASSFRRVALFDAVITDPPYGVREGAKKIGWSSDRMRQLGTFYLRRISSSLSSIV